jgi:hypothetical protein
VIIGMYARTLKLRKVYRLDMQHKGFETNNIATLDILASSHRNTETFSTSNTAQGVLNSNTPLAGALNLRACFCKLVLLKHSLNLLVRRFKCLPRLYCASTLVERERGWSTYYYRMKY